MMLTASLYAVLAATSGLSVDWAPTLNTLLLVVLAVITGYNHRRANRDRAAMAARINDGAKAAIDVQQKITGEQRSPHVRTRKDD